MILTRPSLAVLLDLAVSQPCHYGAADVAVTRRILQLLRELAWCVARSSPQVAGDTSAVLDQLSRAWTVVSEQDLDREDLSELADLAESVREAAHGRWWDPDGTSSAV